MRISTGRRRPAFWLGIALVAASASGLGCAMDGGLLPGLATPIGPRGAAVDEQRAYELGHRYGRYDYQREQRGDYTRHHEEYVWETERAFSTGYRDGYAGRSNRYQPAARGWYDHEDDDHRYSDDRDDDDRDDDRHGVSRAVPDWLVGDYRGWNERYGTDVALTVYPDASVVLVSGGKARQGVYRGGQVHLRESAYGITRARDGIRFTKLDDSRNSVYLRRTD